MKAFCSGCFDVFEESEVTVIPGFESEKGRFVSSFGCKDCMPEMISDLRKRIEQADNDETISQLIDYLNRQKLNLDEHIDLGDPELVKNVLLKIVDKLENGELRLTATDSGNLRSTT